MTGRDLCVLHVVWTDRWHLQGCLGAGAGCPSGIQTDVVASKEGVWYFERFEIGLKSLLNQYLIFWRRHPTSFLFALVLTRQSVVI